MPEINENCLYLKKVLKMIDKITTTTSEDDIPEDIQGSSRSHYLQRRAHRRHEQTSYEDILHEANYDEEKDNSLTVLCYQEGICEEANEDDFVEECWTKQYAYNLIKQQANDVSRNW